MTAHQPPETYLRAWNAWRSVDERAGARLLERWETPAPPAARCLDTLRDRLRTIASRVAERPGDHNAAAADALEALHQLEVIVDGSAVPGSRNDPDFRDWVEAIRSFLRQCALIPWGEDDGR